LGAGKRCQGQFLVREKVSGTISGGNSSRQIDPDRETKRKTGGRVHFLEAVIVESRL